MFLKNLCFICAHLWLIKRKVLRHKLHRPRTAAQDFQSANRLSPARGFATRRFQSGNPSKSFRKTALKIPPPIRPDAESQQIPRALPVHPPRAIRSVLKCCPHRSDKTILPAEIVLRNRARFQSRRKSHRAGLLDRQFRNLFSRRERAGVASSEFPPERFHFPF